jgi:hypothetical protein
MVHFGASIAADVYLRSGRHLRGYPARRCGVDRGAGRNGQGREAAISLPARCGYLRPVYIDCYRFLRLD